MNLQRTLLELLEFYDLEDLARFNEYVLTRTEEDPEELYSLLWDFTDADYRLSGMTPRMHEYIELFKYNDENRNI